MGRSFASRIIVMTLTVPFALTSAFMVVPPEPMAFMPQIVIVAVTSAVAKMIEIWRILLSFRRVELQSTNGQASEGPRCSSSSSEQDQPCGGCALLHRAHFPHFV